MRALEYLLVCALVYLLVCAIVHLLVCAIEYLLVCAIGYLLVRVSVSPRVCNSAFSSILSAIVYLLEYLLVYLLVCLLVYHNTVYAIQYTQTFHNTLYADVCETLPGVPAETWPTAAAADLLISQGHSGPAAVRLGAGHISVSEERR